MAAQTVAPTVPAAERSLPESVRKALSDAGLAATDLAVFVLPLDAKSPPLLQHQADRAMQPASAMKVVTSAVALERLGSSRRAYTELRSAAVPNEGVLRGDVWVRGGADPELGLPQLWALWLELRESGVRRIDGDVLLDRSLFSPSRADLGQPPFDEAPEFPYNVIPDALQWSGNLHPLELRSDGTVVSARLVPALPGVQLDNRLQVLPKGRAACKDWSESGWKVPQAHRDPQGQVTVVLQGQFPADCTVRPSLQLMERDWLAAAQLRWLLAELGIAWEGQLREGESAEVARVETYPLLARREARPWGEWLRQINKVSDNVATRLLYLSVGVEERDRLRRQGVAVPERSTAAWADASVRRWFSEKGIRQEGLVLDNGSGLSRSERISPRQLALVLQAAGRHASAPDLMMGLPLAGVDGSLRLRMVDAPAQGRARLKPGTLRNAVALAGYVDDASGRRWVMAAMVNHDEAPKRGRPVLDAVANWVASGAAAAASR